MARDTYSVRLNDDEREAVEDWSRDRGVDPAEGMRKAMLATVNRGPSDSRLGTFLGWLSAAALTGTLYIVGFVVVLDAPYGREAWVAMFVTVWILAMWGAHETGARDLTIREWVASIRSRG